MVNPDVSLGISLVAFVIFTALLGLGLLSTTLRALRYSHARQTWPRLLKRDLIWQGSLGIDFFLILFVRFAGLGPVVRDNIVWVLVTSGLALIAAATYAYYEIAVIEAGEPKPKNRDGR